MLRNALYSAWNEPAVADPPARVWRDWALLAVLIPAALVEVIVRPDIGWRPFSLVVTLAMLPLLLWRRTKPLASTAPILITSIALSVASFLFTDNPIGLFTNAFILVMIYAVFRWAPGRHCGIVIALMVGVLIASAIADYTGIGDAIGGALVFFLPAEIGALVRNRSTALHQQMEETKLREREQLARELHDTVAHHVSAIAIRAQAGRAMAPADPQAAIDALEVIEEEASRTLGEMRTMVGALRNGAAAELTPQPGVGDIQRLAAESETGLPIRVELTGEFDSLRPSIDTALYRIAQESITNAMRHARRASEVSVSVIGDAESVRLTVRDDGQEGPAIPGRGAEPNREQGGAATTGRFGLVGMAERAKLLGGAFQAGPGPDGGWMVDVVFPRNGAAL